MEPSSKKPTISPQAINDPIPETLPTEIPSIELEPSPSIPKQTYGDLVLPADAPGIIVTFFQVETVYSYRDEIGISIEEIAEILITEMLEDLKNVEDNRAYVINDYKDINIDILDNDSDGLILNDDIMNDNTWLVEGSVSFTYTGSFSPIGPSSIVPEGEYVSETLGYKYIVKEGQVYTLHNQETYEKMLRE